MSIEITYVGAVMLVTIARSSVMNSLDAATNDALARAWDQFETNTEFHVAVLTGQGEKSFCAGADLKTLIPARQAEIAAGVKPALSFGGGLTSGRRLSKPIIAAVNGHCLAGGLELALACDMRICSPNASFGLSEVKWAIIPGAGGTQRLPRNVPLGYALEMILSGDPIDAAEALRVGIVNRIVPRADLVPAALELAGRIASRGPLAIRAARRAVYDGLEHGLEAGLEVEKALFHEVLQTEDAAEGPRAFAEKRQPKYKGA